MNDTDLPRHDLAAEQAVLGAVMAHRHAITAVRPHLPDPAMFFRTAHQTIYATVLYLADQDAPTDAIAVVDHLTTTGEISRVGHGDYLFKLYQAGLPAGDPGYYAAIVARHARHRRAKAALQTADGRLDADTGDITAILTAARDDLDKAAHDTAPTAARVRNVDEFLAGDDDDEDYDWVIPGLLERQDRLILTGPEGGGKSTFLRQLAVQAASGIHPFTGELFPAARVLYIDLENSEKQTRRKIRPLRIQAGDLLSPDRLLVEVRVEGMDLTQPDDRAWLHALVNDIQPDILATGPIYKMANGDPTEEKSAKPVAMALDQIRATAGCCILLEAHAPKIASGQTKRRHEPYGWSGWLRWPEFGLWLDKDGTLDHWRGDREQREWPPALARGGPWPWTPELSAHELMWRRIIQYRAEFGQPLSYRDLAAVMSVPMAQIQRAITPHKDQWEAINEATS